MTTYNNNGQWTLSGDEDTLLFKTNEQKNSGKLEVEERKKSRP